MPRPICEASWTAAPGLPQSGLEDVRADFVEAVRLERELWDTALFAV